jgi:hypothetical protein
MSAAGLSGRAGESQCLITRQRAGVPSSRQEADGRPCD